MAPSSGRDLFSQHHRLFNRFGLGHLDILRRIFAQEFLFLRKASNGTDVDETPPYYCLRNNPFSANPFNQIWILKVSSRDSGEISKAETEVVIELICVGFLCKPDSNLP